MHKDRGDSKKFLYIAFVVNSNCKWKQGENEMKRYLETTEHFSTDKY